MYDSVTPWIPARQASLSFTISGSLLKVISTKMEMLSNHLMLCCPLFLVPSICPSTRVFCIESALHIKWLNYWSFIFSRVPENSKELKPVSPKGNQPWLFIGKIDAKVPILWAPDSKSWLTGKDPDAGKDWGQEKGVQQGRQRRGRMASSTQGTRVWGNSQR